jgi:hypothetical protein
MLRHAILLAAALAAPGAAPLGLDWPVVQFDADGTGCKEVLPDSARTLLGIKLEMTTLDAFERVLGVSPLQKEGDAGEYFEWRCWEAANGDGTVLVVGRGEVDAQVRVLGRGMSFAGRGACPKSKLVSRSLTMKSGVRIGLTRADIERKVGPPTAAGAGWYDRTCLGKKPMTNAERSATGVGPAGAWDVSSRVTVVETDGRAEGFRVVWTVTY